MLDSSVVGWLRELDQDLGVHKDVKASHSVDGYVDTQYCELKQTVRAILLEEGKLNIKAVERLEALGVTVVYDRACDGIKLYLHNGNFTVN